MEDPDLKIHEDIADTQLKAYLSLCSLEACIEYFAPDVS